MNLAENLRKLIDIVESSSINEARLTPDGYYKTPNKYKLIRRVPNLAEVQAGPNGTVEIVRKARHRQTIHFSVNGMVTAHGQGDWSDANIAIVADLGEVGQPGAFSFQDTWYYTDKNNKLNIGKPIILAPAGTPAPKGVTLTYYSGSLEDALEKVLEQDGIQMLTIGAWGPEVGREPERFDGAREAALSKYNYPTDTPYKTHTFSFDRFTEGYLDTLDGLSTYITYRLNFNDVNPNDSEAFKWAKESTFMAAGLKSKKATSYAEIAQIGLNDATMLINKAQEVLRGEDSKYKKPATQAELAHIQKVIKNASAYMKFFNKAKNTYSNPNSN